MVIYLYRVSRVTTLIGSLPPGFIDFVHSYVEKSRELLAQYEYYLLEFGHL